MLLGAATIVAGPAAANPSRSGGGGSIVVGGGSGPSLVVPLLVLLLLLAAVGAAVWWWRRLGGWSPAEMTFALQATGREADRIGAAIDRFGLRSSAAGAAHRRALVTLSGVLRKHELSAVHAALDDARASLAVTANSQAGPLEPDREREPERTA
jgi:hypothetical protein